MYFCNAMRKHYIILYFVICAVVTGNAQVIRNAGNSAIAKIKIDNTVRSSSIFMIVRTNNQMEIHDNSNRYLDKVECDGTVRGINHLFRGMNTMKRCPLGHYYEGDASPYCDTFLYSVF